MPSIVQHLMDVWTSEPVVSCTLRIVNFEISKDCRSELKVFVRVKDDVFEPSY